MKTPQTNRGFIGLIVLMIGVAIIAYFMMVQYKDLGVVPQEATSDTSTDVDSTSGTLGAESETPIDRAEDIKNILDARYH